MKVLLRQFDSISHNKNTAKKDRHLSKKKLTKTLLTKKIFNKIHHRIFFACGQKHP